MSSTATGYLNRELFSEHFLSRLLPGLPEWAAAKEGAEQARRALRDVYSAERGGLSRLKEQQLEERWIRRVLTELGVAYDVQPPLPTDDPRVTLAPDYAFFSNELEREAAQGSDKRGYFSRVRMLGDAKRWGVDFSTAARGERTPRQQLAQYLHLSGVDWGFLTDGKTWRLVHKSVAGRLDHYYQVDLIEALLADDLSAFLYFYLFFGSDALRRPEEGEPSFLDRALRQSQEYAESVSTDLKRAVYEALEALAGAFLVRGQARQAPPSEDLLQRECLTLLYRLLFLLYAEHRGLLPLGNPSYRSGYSLTQTCHRIAAQLDEGPPFSAEAAGLWGHLVSLFEIVDRGAKDLAVPAYNGGLFSAKEHPFLVERKPGDRDLARAIDLLARTPMRSATKHFIDYRDLDIRHLGTIYEGLLEYKLRIADGDLNFAGEHIASGEPYLITDKGQRWVTGSYYTPDFIVEHIVEETLAPLVQGKGYQDILRLRVLDPAMGSGHFLLEAVDYLARMYSQARTEAGVTDDVVTSGIADADLMHYRRLVAEHCIYGVDINPMAVELAKLALWLKTMASDRPLTFLDNHLKWGNSLLGAKVEMIDAPKKTAGRRKKQGGQLNLFENVFLSRLPAMLKEVLRILNLETRSRKDIDLKEAWDAATEQIRRPFQSVADVFVAKLGQPRDPKFEELIMLLYQSDKLLAHPDVVAVKEETANRPFLHFELIFPEVFYDAQGHRRKDEGFDAVIGNPPWVRQENLSLNKLRFGALYPEVFHTAADIYVYFLAAGLRHTRAGGRLGMILPNKWQRADYGEPLRHLLSGRLQPLSLTDFGHAPIFPDADTFPCILLLENRAEKNQELRELCFCPVPKEVLRDIRLTIYVREHAYSVSRDLLRDDGWFPLPPDEAPLFKKIRKAGTPLGKYVGHSPLWGLKTGFNDGFLVNQEIRDKLINKDRNCLDILKKFHRGGDSERWHMRWSGDWMIAMESSNNKAWPWAQSENEDDAEAVFRTYYPSIYEHMKSHEQRLRRRQDRGRYWWELRSSEIYNRLGKSKILYPQIQFHSGFALDKEGFYLLDTMFWLPTGDVGLLAVLNSSLMWWYMWRTAPRKKTEAFGLHAFYMENLPIVPVAGDGAEELCRLTAQRQEHEDQFLGWLQLEMGLERVTKSLATFWRLDEPAFLRELKKANLQLSPASLSRVRSEFQQAKDAILPVVGRAREVELLSHELVCRQYGLTRKEMELLRRTAPPRDPLARL